MADSNDAYVKDVLSFFYPLSPPGAINPRLREVAAEMLHGALEMSKALDFVPRPAGMKPGVGWLISQAVQMFWRSSGKQKIYEIARTTVAMKYRSIYEMAKQGI